MFKKPLLYVTLISLSTFLLSCGREKTPPHNPLVSHVEPGPPQSGVAPLNQEKACAFVKAHVAPQLQELDYTLTNKGVQIGLEGEDSSIPVLVDEKTNFQFVNRLHKNRYTYLTRLKVLRQQYALKKISEFYEDLCSENVPDCTVISYYHSPKGFNIENPKILQNEEKPSPQGGVQSFSRSFFTSVTAGPNKFFTFSLEVNGQRMPLTTQCL